MSKPGEDGYAYMDKGYVDESAGNVAARVSTIVAALLLAAAIASLLYFLTLT